MKWNIKSVKCFLLCAMIWIGISSIRSDNLYVYTKAGAKQEFALNESIKLTFTENSLLIEQGSESPESLLYSDVRFFSLKDFYSSRLHSEPAQSVQVYPTIATDKVIVENAAGINGLGLFDVQGRKVLQFIPTGQQQIEVPLSMVSSGVYFLHLVNEKDVIVKKIIKK